MDKPTLLRKMNGARKNKFELPDRSGSGESLPMGKQNVKRGRKPKRPSPFTKNFTNLLKENGCSIRRAAEVAGVSPSVVSGWTAGATPSDLSALLKITEHLRADFQFVLTNVPSNAIPAARIGEIFEVEDHPDLSGIFLLEAKRLKARKLK